MRRQTVAGLVVLCATLTSCDNFLEIRVHNPCPFAVNVAFRGIHAPPPPGSWPYQNPIPARSEQLLNTAGPAGPYPATTRVQVSAEGHDALVDTIAVPEDNSDWFIPESFCG